MPHHFDFRQRSRALKHQNPLERGESDHRRGDSNRERHGTSIDGATGATSKTSYSESVHGYSSQSDGGRGDGRRERDDRGSFQEELNKKCPSCWNYFTDTFSEDLSESEAKNNLKKAILERNWSDDEWMELTEAVRRKRAEAGRVHVPYVNLPSPASFSSDFTCAVDSSYPKTNGEKNRRVGMPPYENLNQESARSATLPYHDFPGDASQTSLNNDFQRLTNRSQGKPPIPTPRSKRSSI